MAPTEGIKRAMTRVQTAFEYKALQRAGMTTLEDGEPIQEELRARSIQLIEQGWEPIAEDQDYRRYRRPKRLSA